VNAQPGHNNGGCATSEALLGDLLDEDLLQLKDGERLWKLYCFVSPEGKATGLRHRIYTKHKADGRLTLVTFAIHHPAEGRSVRSAIARVPDLSPEALEQIIESIRWQTHASPEDYEELDLSGIATLAEQLARLEQKEA
jgi:hypothetical protein